jgi:regulatory protein
MSSRQHKRPDREPDRADCKRRALDLLARREHSRLELERKLARTHPDDVVAPVLDALESAGLLVAKRFAESFVRSRVARGQGPVRIRVELAARGIDESQSAAFLDADAFDWHALARAARAKRFGDAAPRDFKERAKQGRFLQGRGFEHDQIARALDDRGDSD